MRQLGKQGRALEDVIKEEVVDLRTEMQKKLDEAHDKVARYYDQVFETEFYAVVCFQTDEQRQTWLTARGLEVHDSYFLDGQVVAEKDGVQLPPALPWKEKRVKERWSALAMSSGKKG